MRDVKVKYFIGVVIMMFWSVQMMGQNRNIIGTYVPKKLHKTNNTDYLIADLANTITANARTESEKVYAIYRWITANIKYDNRLRFSEKLQKEIYVSEENVVAHVLERKMALCGGFAFLFRDLCEEVDIPVEAIHGYSKINGSTVRNYEKPNHTWNAVKLNGKWHLLDITWAVGFGNAKNPDDFWYLTSPEDFIYSHYPKNPEWTLLDNSISFQKFKSR